MLTTYQRVVAETWSPSAPMSRNAGPRELVRYACLAASSHNTQPWRLEVGPDFIVIRPDFSRRCAAVDPDDHHLHASLGCAAENFVVAAQAAGWSSAVSYDPTSTGLRIEMQSAAPTDSSLRQAILTRQCTRTPYDGKPLSVREREALDGIAPVEGVSILLLTSDPQKSAVADYVAEGNLAQFADPAWAAELRSWIRFNATDAIRTRDWLYGPVMGNPDVPTWLGRAVMKISFSAEAQNRKDRRNIASSSAIAVIHSAKDDPQHWIAAGRCYERLALQAAALDLRTAFVNQPLEVGRLRPQFARYLGLGDRRPDLAIRIGHAPLGPKSLRRPVEEVLMPGDASTTARSAA